MIPSRALLLALAACGNSVNPADASSDAQSADASDVMIADVADALDALEAAAPCKTGLPDSGTDAVVCYDSTSCTSPDVCCIGNTGQCTQSCGNLNLVWECDRSAHCGGGKCCYDLLDPDFTTCPGRTAATGPFCQGVCPSSAAVVCQTDADCNDGQTCYAVFIDLGDAASRTIGLCL